MKNIKAYDKNGLEFHKSVTRSKRNSPQDPTYTNRVSDLNLIVQKQFNIFENKFEENKLEDLISLNLTDKQKSDLIKLYSYKSKLIQKLKIKLTTDEQNRIVNTCQNCTIGEVNSFDHFIPKDEFAEFTVNPKNLFPSCTKCNGLKGIAWRNGNEKLFLNLYLDELPQKQYLFVNVWINSGVVDVKYYLKNLYGINDELFNLIENHYEKLNLFQRFRENSDSIISELVNTINSFIGYLKLDEVKKVIIDKCEADKKIYGYNYWKSILVSALVNDTNFMDS